MFIQIDPKKVHCADLNGHSISELHLPINPDYTTGIINPLMTLLFNMYSSKLVLLIFGTNLVRQKKYLVQILSMG